jgi:D-sedoheptulose 7-phosphate isomerase
MSLNRYLAETEATLRETIDAGLEGAADAAIEAITEALRADRPLLICGNGGSAADAMHIAGELVGRYKRDRRGLRAIALGADPAVLTAWSNDHAYEDALARQVEALGAGGGVLWALSTSGNSENVLRAAKAASGRGMTVIAFTGAGGGHLKDMADIWLGAPTHDTPRVQEIHTCLYHYVCEQVEAALA